MYPDKNKPRILTIDMLKEITDPTKVSFEEILMALTDPKKAFVLVVDMQNGYRSNESAFSSVLNLDLTPVQEMTPPLIKFLEKADFYGVPIGFTQMDENHKHVRDNVRLKMLAFLHPWLDPTTEGEPSFNLVDELKQLAKNGVIFYKNNYDAFINPKYDPATTNPMPRSPLEQHLRDNNIETVIIAGVIGSRCVRETAFGALRCGFNVIVVTDLVSAPKELQKDTESSFRDLNAVCAHLATSDQVVGCWAKRESIEKTGKSATDKVDSLGEGRAASSPAISKIKEHIEKTRVPADKKPLKVS